MKAFTCRPFRRASDFAAAARLHQALNALEADMGAPRDSSPQAARRCLEEDLALVATQGGAVLVAEIDGAVVGYASLIRDRRGPYVPEAQRDYIYIKNLVVLEAHRGAGIGRALLAQAETVARENGCKVIALGVVPRNSTALAVYEKAGFAPIAIEMARVLDETSEKPAPARA